MNSTELATCPRCLARCFWRGVASSVFTTWSVTTTLQKLTVPAGIPQAYVAAVMRMANLRV